jgi:hypothetical protein
VILGSDTGLLNREKAAPQLLLRSFPPPSNREILRGNRELSRDNREFHAVLPPDAIRQETPSLGSTTLPTRRQTAFTGGLQAKCCANFRRISASARCPLFPRIGSRRAPTLCPFAARVGRWSARLGPIGAARPTSDQRSAFRPDRPPSGEFIFPSMGKPIAKALDTQDAHRTKKSLEAADPRAPNCGYSRVLSIDDQIACPFRFRGKRGRSCRRPAS